MQNLDVISVNLWQILISLINLILMYRILKRFLFRPVKAIVAKREEEVEGSYREAAKQRKEAEALGAHWEEKLSHAQEEAEKLMLRAEEEAAHRRAAMLAEAREEAAMLLRNARTEAELEKEKARAEIREQIVEISHQVATSVLEREVSSADQERLVDDFLKDLKQNEERE